MRQTRLETAQLPSQLTVHFSRLPSSFEVRGCLLPGDAVPSRRVGCFAVSRENPQPPAAG